MKNFDFKGGEHMRTGGPEHSRFDRWCRSVWDAVKVAPHRRGWGARLIHAGLDAAYERSGDAMRLDVGRDKLVIFSDHHRGDRETDADDFRRCERAYRTALAHYYELGYTLVLLGDVDELWENRLSPVAKAYTPVVELERRFHEQGRLWRFYGNHDLVWSSPRKVAKHLAARFGGPLPIWESLKLDAYDADERIGRFFLVHGHQGTPSSDLFAPIAMLPVRYIWPKLQKSVKFASTTPAQDSQIRAEHDERMFEWAKQKVCTEETEELPLVLIAGHTHKPVFLGRRRAGGAIGDTWPSIEEANAEYQAALDDGSSASDRAARHAMVEFVTTKEFAPAKTFTLPCYFNSGCCSYGDGDVTGLEIATGDMRLVRWLDNDGAPALHPLSEPVPVKDVFVAVTAGADT